MQQTQRAGFSQEQRLNQTMNTQILQSIKLMEMPIVELREKIEEELERNPALELVSDKSTISIEDVYKAPKEENNYFEGSSDSGFIRHGRGEAESDERRQFIEGVLTQSETLQEHLLWQFRLAPVSKTVRAIGEVLIQNIDADGFNITSPEKFFDAGKYCAHDLEKALAVIRRLDPQGCCTKNYKESLEVQAEIQFGIEAPSINKIIPYLEEAERGKFALIARNINEDPDEIESIFEKIKSLNPFPGRQFKSGNSGETRFVIPDIQVIRAKDDFSIILNDEEIPVLGIQPFFIKQSTQKMKGAERDFVKENIKEAQWFIHSINRRNHTLLRVTRAIVEFQREFFMAGPKYLVPLTLHDIAAALDVHETTVSRTSNGKYVQTEWGVFEIRHFFSNSISGSGSGGSRYSQEGVKEIIREIISKDAGHLSDQNIADVLAERGIPLARRTVAKYRKQLDLGSSYKR
jgi:RNA polymerase sigma-54 factor